MMQSEFDRPPEPNSDSVKWQFARRISDSLEPYWVADMDFAAPEPVIDAVRERLENRLLGYTFAREELYAAFSDWLDTRIGTRPASHWCMIPGVMAGVRAAVSLYTRPGDGVIVQTPVYFPFMDAVEGQGRTVVVNELRHDGDRYRFDFDSLETAAAAGARVLLLCSPHNPVGRVWNVDELQQLVDICRRYGVLLVSDEIHGDLVMAGYRFIPTRDVDCRGLRLLTLSSATKSFNIPGLPSAIASSDDETMIRTIREHLHRVGADTQNALTLTAVEAAYRSGGEWLDAVLSYIADNERAISEVFEASRLQVRLEPLEGTYLLWIDCTRLSMNDVALRDELQKRADAWLVEGSKFGSGGEGHLRMNIAAPRDRIVAAAERIVTVLEELS